MANQSQEDIARALSDFDASAKAQTDEILGYRRACISYEQTVRDLRKQREEATAEITRLRAELKGQRDGEWQEIVLLRERADKAEAALAAAERHIQLSGGYHARTPLELGVRIMAESGLPLEAARVIDLLDLIDAGRNRVHSAEEALAALRAQRCGNCDHAGRPYTFCGRTELACRQLGRPVEPDFGCVKWRQREGA